MSGDNIERVRIQLEDVAAHLRTVDNALVEPLESQPLPKPVSPPQL